MNYLTVSKMPRSSKLSNALKIINAGLETAMPQKRIEKIISSNQISLGKRKIYLKNFDSIFLVGFGKAADSMAQPICEKLKIKKGIIVIPKGTKPLFKKKNIQFYQSSHPFPNKTSVTAAKNIRKFLIERKKGELVIFLVSGGSSSLISWPDNISLEDKIQVTKQLLRHGATIQEINCVRKHLSKIKGGKLVEGIRCNAISLVISDVLGDDISSIASGTTYFDKTSFSQALKILQKYDVENKIPSSVFKQIKLGSQGKIKESPKKSKIPHRIILRNKDCLNSMKKKSRQLGISTKTITISGLVSKEATRLVKKIPTKKNSCLIFGGEPTVKVKGKGKGGRNQELVLHILQKLQESKKKVIVASIGTDGIDGNTKSAGAITPYFSVKKNELQNYLKNNDSNSFFKKYGGVINTGYTHTNLMDIGLILV